MDVLAQPNRPLARNDACRRQTPAPFAITLWLLISALLSSGGWILSAFHQLNAIGYACYLFFAALSIILWLRCRGFEDLRHVQLLRLVRRFKRPLPAGFLFLAVLAFVGGMLYAPINYDALAYRVPRVLHWLTEGRWHWVHTDFPRLNDRACGAEWLMAPVLALTKSVRWIFIFSFISFLLLPGLFYSVFIRFGVNRRVAWAWMWITAAGCGYVLQAGSIANDLLGAVYVLAAFDFALRVRQSKRLEDFWLFMIAAALMTGSKASNFPLLLPLFIIICPNWRLLLLKPARTFLVIVFAGLASFLPTAIFNLKYCGDWTGMRLEGPTAGPFVQLASNTAIWFIQNGSPPIFPFAGWWNHPLADNVAVAYRLFYGVFHAEELQTEESGGLGMGVCLLLAASCVAGFMIRRRSPAGNGSQPSSFYWKLVIWSPWLSLLVFGLKAQVVASSARLIIPYYAILIVPLLLFSSEKLLRRRWWKCMVAVVFATTAIVTVLSPSRPLWPANYILAGLKKSHPSSPFIARAQTVYSVFSKRSDCFAPLIAALPPDATVLGFVTFDDPEASLWWPLGARRIEHVLTTDTREDLEARGIHYIVVPSRSFALHESVDAMLQKYDAVKIKTLPLLIRAGQGATDWYILQLNPKAAPGNGK
ncbi:MAG: hypothetical protein JWR26_3390 [Pedosphaera sp.]|nr:hypothetical protein [Pedosphaera sp.]